MAKQELLAKLKDVHLPPEVSWWPLAIGWWILIGLFVTVLIAIAIQRHLKAKKFRLSKLAIQELEKIKSSEARNWLMQLEVLLKRASLAHFPKSKVASLTHDSWIRFLQNTGENIWDDHSLLLLKDSVYQDLSKIPSTHRDTIFSQSEQWLSQIAIVSEAGVKNA